MWWMQQIAEDVKTNLYHAKKSTGNICTTVIDFNIVNDFKHIPLDGFLYVLYASPEVCPKRKFPKQC